MLFKIYVLKNFAIFIRKHLCWGQFGLLFWVISRPATSLKRNPSIDETQAQKYLRTAFLYSTSGGCFLIFERNMERLISEKVQMNGS